LHGRKQRSVLGYDLFHHEADGLEQVGIRGEGGRIDYHRGEQVGRAKRRVPLDLANEPFKPVQFFGGDVEVDRDDRRLTAGAGSDDLLKRFPAIKYRAGFLTGVGGDDDVRRRELRSALLHDRLEFVIHLLVPFEPAMFHSQNFFVA
jgi:hypothetical protein